MPATNGTDANQSPTRGRLTKGVSQDKKTRSETSSNNETAKSSKTQSPTRARARLQSEPSSPGRARRKNNLKKQQTVDGSGKSNAKGFSSKFDLDFIG